MPILTFCRFPTQATNKQFPGIKKQIRPLENTNVKFDLLSKKYCTFRLTFCFKLRWQGTILHKSLTHTSARQARWQSQLPFLLLNYSEKSGPNMGVNIL